MNSFHINKAARSIYLTPSLKKMARIAARSLAPGKPHHAQWMITRKCNYRCRGCNIWQEQDKEELSTEEIKRGLDILEKLGIVEVVISGGDPLLRDDAKEIIEYASQRFVTTVYDNGSMAAKKIDALRNVDFSAISIDSLDPAKNDYIRGTEGAFETAVETVEKLHTEGINVAVTPTISQMNLGEIVDITNHFTGKGIPVWYCLYSYDHSIDSNSLFKIGKAKDDFIITDKQAMVNLCNSLIEMKRKNNRILMTTKLLKTLRDYYAQNKRDWNCRALENFIVINHNGRIAGCHVHNPAASIFDLPKMWKSDEFKKLRETYNSCKECTYLCYIFYSLHAGPYGNLTLARDQWRNSKLLLGAKAKPLSSAEMQ
jgi:MoaA/NifB/PqqE/SkfB family radical SAM enzyme